MNEKINIIDDSEEILSIFNRWKKNKEKLWIWQLDSSKNGDHKLFNATIIKVDYANDIKTVDLKPTNTDGFELNSKIDTFIYSKVDNLACKTGLAGYDIYLIKLNFPKTLGVMSPELFSKLQLIEKENEDIYLEKRKEERGKMKVDKVVQLRRFSENKNIRHPTLTFNIYDLSKGGLSFLVDDPAEFHKDEILEISKIDKNEFKAPMKCKVMGKREQDGSYKIGIMFI